MENQGDIDAQTLAGAISTATHGTGARFRNISSQVEAMRLVTASGEVLEIGAGDPEPAARAARVGLGALGAISDRDSAGGADLHARAPRRPDAARETLDDLDELRRRAPTTSSCTCSRTPTWR